MSEEGTVLEKCEVCTAVNEITDTANPGQCWRCHANLPKPSTKNIIREIAREIDWGAVGLSGDALKKYNSSKNKLKDSDLEEAGEGGDYGK